jgi:hypothetical protein
MAFLKQSLLLLCVSTVLLGKMPEEELIMNVLKLLQANEKALKVFDHHPSHLLEKYAFEHRVQECTDAHLIYGETFETLPSTCKNLPRFSTEYEQFQKDEKVIGAFYWRKGRPQLRFNEKRCKDFNITLPQELAQYAY